MKIASTYNIYSKFENDIDLNYFKFPIISKSIIADGCESAHQCYFIYNKGGLSQCKYPCIIQQYYNHDGYVYKIYIIGNNIYQKIHPSATPTSSCYDKSIEFIQHLTSNDIYNNNIVNNIITFPSMNLLKKLVQKLKEIFKLSLFGVDLIYNLNEKIYYIIDINYFPSYSGFPELQETFLSFFDTYINNL